MGETANSIGGLSESDLACLADLYRQFEGAADPLTQKAKEAEVFFNLQISNMYEEKVKPHFSSVSFPAFKSHARNLCRKRVAAEDQKFPCV